VRITHEKIKDLKNRIALLEKSASIYELKDDFKFEEGDSPSEIARKIETELGELYQNVVWRVTKAHAKDGEVQFVAKVNGIMPAEMIPIPWSVENVINKLENVFGDSFSNNEDYAMLYGVNAVLGETANLLNHELHYSRGVWEIIVEEGLADLDQIPDSLWSYVSKIQFKVKSTGSVSKDVELLTAKIKKYLIDFKKFKG